MVVRSARTLGGFFAAVVLLVAVPDLAAAETIEIESTRFKAVWAEFAFSNGTTTVRCPVTMEGTFASRSFTPSRGLLVGRIIRASVNEASCSGGSFRFRVETLPWSIRYEEAVGTLPEITALELKLVGVRMLAEISRLQCELGSTEAHPLKAFMEIRSLGVEVTGLRLDERTLIPLGGEFLCFLTGEARFSGTASVVDQGATTELEIVVGPSFAPLSFTPGSPIGIPVEPPTKDVRVGTTVVSTLGTLRIVGKHKAAFAVSEGCNGRRIGTEETRTCTVTVLYQEESGINRPTFARLLVPFSGKWRTPKIEAP